MPRASLRRSAALLIAVCSMMVLAQCSSGRDAQPGAPTTTLLVTYGAKPTESAMMVCGAEGQTELGAAFSITPVRVTTPTWADHVYACTYEYPSGSFSLSVKELPTIASTVDYYKSLRAKYPVADALALGQEGFTASDGTSVVRKDNKVLVVDVAKLPDQFGAPAQNRNTASLTIAGTLLGCWTGE